jgi:hypothetical protein
MQTKVQQVLFGVALASGLLLSSAAHASQEFPEAIKEAAGMPCVPGCVLCHGQAVGDAGSFFNRQFTHELVAAGTLPAPHATDTVKADYAALAMKAATDPATAKIVMDLKSGIDPDTGDSLCGPVYGCGASHIVAKAPPSDVSLPYFIAGALMLGNLLRRRKRKG